MTSRNELLRFFEALKQSVSRPEAEITPRKRDGHAEAVEKELDRLGF
jgi:hypothetical protein